MKGFLNFLKENDILAAIIVTVISTYVSKITQSFINDIIIPIIERDGDNDGKADIKKLQNYKLKCFGITFKIGSFLINLIKFSCVMLMIYSLFMFKTNKKIYKVNSPSFVRK
tara:strand:- start:10 stop:345 length:336 start_codon:yes stop_codon:yes gene_type:complete